MTKIAIHQPNFLPWLGFFHKMSLCDVFILLDDAQVNKSSYFNQTSVKGNDGKKILVPLPLKKCSLETRIDQLEASDQQPIFIKKFLKTLTQYYTKAPHFQKHFPPLKAILEGNYRYVWELNRDLLFYCAKALHLPCEITIASSFHSKEEKEARIIDLVKKAGGTTYISGSGAKDYQDPEHFQDEGIELVYSDFKITPYRQLYGEFIGGLSVIDYLFNAANG